MKLFKTHLVFSLLLLLIFTFSFDAGAQITIGSDTKPIKGALLDLKENDNAGSNSDKGLGMPRVRLTSIDNIAADISGTTEAEKNNYAGLVVYNVSTNLCIDLLPGLYVWNGDEWGVLGKSRFPSEVDVLIDDRDPTNLIRYRIGKFGNAGWWMLENLRANTWPKTTSEKPGIQALQEQIAPNIGNSATIPRYRYPGNNPNILDVNPEYGLLYNWAAATGDRDPTQILITSENDLPYPPAGPPNQPLIQGICPEGWHLPSFRDISQLERAINLNPCLYGTKVSTALPGYNMRGKNIVPGSAVEVEAYSRDYDEGGFNALLVGSVSGNNVFEYGVTANFWTSSVANRTNAFSRNLTETNAATTGSNLLRYRLFSVRCKKTESTE